MPEPNDCTDQELLLGIDSVNGRVCASQRELFRFIAEVDRRELWQDSGARDMAHWLVVRYGISYWKARRWIQASHALKNLPLIAQAFISGELGIDKVVELTRFATPETEAGLVVWAQGVSCGCIREKADLAHRSLQEAQEAEQARSLSWWYFEENSRFGLSAELPAAEGAVVAHALERLANQLPVMPGEDGEWSVEARRADALVAVCSARIAKDADPDRATVVIHARVEELGGELHSCEIRRRSCDPPRGGPAPGMQWTHPDSDRGRDRPAGASGTDQQGAPGVDASPAQIPGSRVHLPGVRRPAIHSGPSHCVVGLRRPDGPRQPGPRVHLPPQAGA